jgi:hypothetical protein
MYHRAALVFGVAFYINKKPGLQVIVTVTNQAVVKKIFIKDYRIRIADQYVNPLPFRIQA